MPFRGKRFQREETSIEQQRQPKQWSCESWKVFGRIIMPVWRWQLIQASSSHALFHHFTLLHVENETCLWGLYFLPRQKQKMQNLTISWPCLLSNIHMWSALDAKCQMISIYFSYITKISHWEWTSISANTMHCVIIFIFPYHLESESDFLL